MGKAKKTAFYSSLVLFVLVFIGLGVYFGLFQQQVLGGQVWTPRFYTAECEPRADNKELITITSHRDVPTWYHCTTADAGKYIPEHPGIQCDFLIQKGISFSAYVCDGETEKDSD